MENCEPYVISEEETITDIEEHISYKTLDVTDFRYSWEHTEYTGYRVNTTKRTIEVMIGNGQSSCEEYGDYLQWDNKPITRELIRDKIIGKKIKSITRSVQLTHIPTMKEIMNTKVFKPSEPAYLCLKIELDTNGEGTFAPFFTMGVYNKHEGYYSHDAFVDYSVDNERNYYSFHI